MYAQLETFGRGGEPRQKHRQVSYQWYIIRLFLNVWHSTLLAATHNEYGAYNESDDDEWNQDQHDNAGVESGGWRSRC
jgi:hypothetical protein